MELSEHLTCDALESAANYVQRLILNDYESGDLYFRLKYDPYQPDKVTISGLAPGDYQSLSDLEVPEFVHSHLKAIPQELKDQLSSTQSIYTMGLLPIIGRAYMTIDADLYVWNYEDGSDLAFFDGIPNTITKVAIAKPKSGVFQKHIQYLVIVATTKELMLLAASFSSSCAVSDAPIHPDDYRQNDMYLLPDPLFKVPVDDSTVSDIITTSNGRIFFTEDESLLELVYQNKGWFSPSCRKINHSKSFISYFLPSVSLLTGKEERIVRLCLDDRRHILYSLSQNGCIQVYDLHADGNCMEKVASMNSHQIKECAALECRSIDASFFADILAIDSIPPTHSRYLHLVATTRKGVRLFFSCYPPAPRNAYQLASRASVMKWMEGLRPSCLRLKHIRLPPGHGISSATFQPLTIYDALQSDEVGIMAGEAGVDISSLSLFCSSNFPNLECFTESVTQLRLRSLVMMMTRFIPRLHFLKPAGESSDLTFHRGLHENFVILCEQGIQIIHHRTPVDMLRDILLQFGPDSSRISYFSGLHGMVNVCDMALTILCTDSGANNVVKDSALRLFFILSGEKIRKRHLMSPLRAGHVGEWPHSSESLSEISLNIRSPLFASTPRQQKRSAHSPRNAFPEMPLISVEQSSLSNEVITYASMTHRHNALYLHFSRIIGNSWIKPLCIYDNDKLVSMYSFDEVEWLLCQLMPFKKVVEDYELIGNVREYVQPISPDGEAPTYRNGAVSVSERRSLLVFRELLSITVEVLMLWKILCEHQFHSVTTLLNVESRKCLAATNFCNLVAGRQQLCAELITCLVRHYLSDNATTSVLCNELRKYCPTIFSVDDANTTKATEMIEEVRRSELNPARKEILQEAVNLLRAGVQKINLQRTCQLLYEVNYVEGIVDLALERAKRDDSKMLAIVVYNNRSGESDIRAQEAFGKRRDAYRCITEVLDRLIIDEKTMGTPNPAINLIVSKVFESKDELANVSIFKWLLDNGRSNDVLESKSPFLEAFLHRRVEEGGSSRYLDLLWRFHERNGDHKKAANLLYQLAQRETDSFDIQRRVAYLSQAAMCIQTLNSDSSNKDDLHDLVIEIRDKLDVAQVQLATRDFLLSQPLTQEKAAAVAELGKRLYTVQELFENFAVPLDLPDIKLALCFCSYTYDEAAVEDFYHEIIERELSSTEDEVRDIRIERLGTRIAGLAKKYAMVPKYYPLEAILLKLISRGMREGFPPSFLHYIGTVIGAPLNNIIDALLNSFRNDPFYQYNNIACNYLMQSASYVITKFLENPAFYSYQLRTALASKCLDLVAAFLIHLSHAELSGSDRNQVVEKFRSLQTALENI